ncbi:HAMP domain-containing protein [Mycobacterium fragae]|uniref:Cyclase n=1 Tax=Mycobacterium fragae TaxID=1260918 RepID=A0A1X1V393_9MYCO|nr:adenylate/guanylate cyclase domain-containing protein [Mycobacterium fragae]MCV7399694.1 HAMP domain-containing protein [Mycobacterium fragae]ORV63530.1 cyclase [Mycobacterium fragae]
MDRFWEWAWDRYGIRYSWVVWAFTALTALPTCLITSFLVLGYERSSHYVDAVAVRIIAVLVMSCCAVPPGGRQFHLAERWKAGHGIDRAAALEDTYIYARRSVVRCVAGFTIGTATLALAVGAIAGATNSRLVQYGFVGAVPGFSMSLIGVHALLEGAVRPVRAALAGDTAIGDALPRSRPTIAEWSNMAIFAIAFGFAAAAALTAAVFNRSTSEVPVLAVVIGLAYAVGVAVPITVGTSFSPLLRPVRDLAQATERVAVGDYSQRVPVVQDDDLGALAASFNRMQAGLAERQRLQAAFGTYVDPALAARLLEQGDDVFSGERREVTVMFVDVRDFTPFAEANSPDDTVSRLNALFEIVVPAVVDAGGHVNKFLGDGALAVFGAPNDLAEHADAAVTAAKLIHRLVAEQFGAELRIGIGVNTGEVIAGTIGGGSKLEFTLIGDTVNVAARVEQLTKITGDAILLTQQCVDALACRPTGLIDRGLHTLKGKSETVQVFGLEPETDPRIDIAD